MLIGIFMNLFPTLGKYPIDIFAAAVNAVLIFYSIYKYKLINYSKVAISFLYSTILVAVASLTFLLIFLVIQHFSTRFNVGNILQISFILGVSTTIIIHPETSSSTSSDGDASPSPLPGAIRELSRA